MRSVDLLLTASGISSRCRHARKMDFVPPSTKDGFSYAGGAFYCEASNHNRYRRATIPELRAIFLGQDMEDRTAYWYEAQLLHYGLPPSKQKGISHKRLFDAVMKGDLSVPPHIHNIETEVKEDWTKREKAARKENMENRATAFFTKSTKRKVDEDVAESSPNTGGSVNSKKSTSNSIPNRSVPSNSKPPEETILITAAGSSASGATRPKQTARKSTSTRTAELPKGPEATATPKKSEPQTANQSTHISRGSGPARSSGSRSILKYVSSHHESDDPPPYSEHDPNRQESQGSTSRPRPRSIGLLNGRYRVSCPFVERNYPLYADELSIIATLDCNTLWLSFNFGIATGIMKTTRPWPDYLGERNGMFRRGAGMELNSIVMTPQNIDQLRRAGPFNVVVFNGGGHIHGSIYYGSVGSAVHLEFDAYRISGQSMSSSISPSQARCEWERLREEYEAVINRN